MNDTFEITEAEDGQRLDHVLTKKYTQFSRSKIQKWFTLGQVTLNGKKVLKHAFVSIGQTVVVAATEEVKTKLARPKGFELSVLYSDDDILVIEKAAGVLVHPATNTNEWTIANELEHLNPGIIKVGNENQRHGIVHRLDRDVSGVMVTARTQAAFESLQQQFAARTITKEYRAIVHGVPSKTHDDIRFVIARSATHPSKMAARPEHAEGKDAWTEYELMRSNRGLSELQVWIHTGRTHQIRAHFLAIGHPIVGDILYNSSQYDSTKTYPRLFLHSHKLSFTHPITGENVAFTSQIPEVFEQQMTT